MGHSAKSCVFPIKIHDQGAEEHGIRDVLAVHSQRSVSTLQIKSIKMVFFLKVFFPAGLFATLEIQPRYPAV